VESESFSLETVPPVYLIRLMAIPTLNRGGRVPDRQLALSLQAALGWHIQQNRQVRHCALYGEGIHLSDQGQVEASSIALVGKGRVRKTIADDDPPGLQRWLDDLIHQLRSGGQE